MTLIDNKDCNITKDYEFSFIGNKDDIDKDKMFNNFDINYLNINNLPISYYPIYKKELLDNITNHFIDSDPAALQDIKDKDKANNTKIANEFKRLMSDMENNKLSYNKYTILPIIIITIIIWIFIIMFFLKYIHHHYNIYYIYFITTVIIILLIFGSLWFLYVNSELI